MYLSIYLSINPSMCETIHPSLHQSIHLWIYLSSICVKPSIHLSMNPSIQESTYSSTVCVRIYSSIHPTLLLRVHQSKHGLQVSQFIHQRSKCLLNLEVIISVGNKFILIHTFLSMHTFPSPCTRGCPPCYSCRRGSAGLCPAWWSWSEWWWFSAYRTETQTRWLNRYTSHGGTLG